MRDGIRHTATRWLLLCVLFLGVVGMHHVTMSSDIAPPHGAMSVTVNTPERQAPEEPEPHPAHDMLHLCVAVLFAVVSLLLLTLALTQAARPPADELRTTSAWPRAPDHPPPIGGRALLSSVCVLRL